MFKRREKSNRSAENGLSQIELDTLQAQSQSLVEQASEVFSSHKSVKHLGTKRRLNWSPTRTEVHELELADSSEAKELTHRVIITGQDAGESADKLVLGPDGTLTITSDFGEYRGHVIQVKGDSISGTSTRGKHIVEAPRRGEPVVAIGVPGQPIKPSKSLRLAQETLGRLEPIIRTKLDEAERLGPAAETKVYYN